MNSNQPKQLFPFQISKDFVVPSQKINPDGSFFFLIRPNFQVSQRKSLVPLFYILYNGNIHNMPGYIVEIPPCQVSTKSGEKSRTLSFVVIQQNNGNALWDLKKSYFFLPDESRVILTIFLDFSQESIEQNEHLSIMGKNLQLFQVMGNPSNLDIKTRNFCYWLSPPYQKQNIWLDKMNNWHNLSNLIASHEENFLSNVGHILGHIEIPNHSPQSGFLTQKKLRNDCSYLFWISGSCLSGACFLYLCDAMKRKLIHSQFSTIWNANETAEFIVYLPPGQGEIEIDFGILCADHDRNIVFVLHEFCILQLTENLYSHPWELPYMIKEQYASNSKESKYGAVWFNHKEKF